MGTRALELAALLLAGVGNLAALGVTVLSRLQVSLTALRERWPFVRCWETGTFTVYTSR
jgi:hypothetical protein